MKNLRSLFLAFTFLTVFGLTSCADDETLQELIDETELKQEMATGDGDDDSTPGKN